uniref:Uncharacterized protein n=1 Tax=Arundo donax TaxID=35708 RepID=A0A0A8Y311_ARUDO
MGSIQKQPLHTRMRLSGVETSKER